VGACGSSTCDKFNESTAKWFKLQSRPDCQKVGREHLVQQDVSAYHSPLSSSRTPHQHAKTQLTVNGKPTSVTFPTQVAPGDYLVRREIIVLHLAVKLGEAEFYLSCTQIHVRVGGCPTGYPQPDRLLPRRIR